MDTSSFESLRQVLYEPLLRVKLAENISNAKYQCLLSIKADGGYFKDIDFKFCPELNIIIEPRGSGKSVLIDMIKFVFGKYDPLDKDAQPFLQRLYDLFPWS